MTVMDREYLVLYGMTHRLGDEMSYFQAMPRSPDTSVYQRRACTQEDQ